MQRSYMIVITKRLGLKTKQNASHEQYSKMRQCELQLKVRREEIKRRYEEMLEPVGIIAELNNIEFFRAFYKAKLVPILEQDNPSFFIHTGDSQQSHWLDD